MTRLLTTDQVADLLACKKSFIKRLRARGLIPFTRIGWKTLRYPADGVEKFISKRTVNGNER